MIGEIRDRETMQHALLHTLTGHLCLATLHANNSYHALSRIINMFPYDARSGLLSDLSIGLRAIVSQRLVRNKEGGLQPAVEILLNSSLIAELVKNGEITQIKEAMEKSLYPGRRRSSRRSAASTSTSTISYDEAMTASDSSTNLAWLINQNAPTGPRRQHGARRRRQEAAANATSDFTELHDRAGHARIGRTSRRSALACARLPASRASRTFPLPAWISPILPPCTPPCRHLALTRALIERRSLTPDDAGCQALIGARLAPLGFRAETLAVERRDATDGCAAARRVRSSCFAGHTDVVPTGPLARLAVGSVRARPSATAGSTAAAPPT